MMIRVTVRFMSVVRLRTGTGGGEFSFPKNSLRDVLLEIVKKYNIADIMLTEEGEVRRWARVFVNGRSHELVGGLNLTLADGDRIALVFPYAEAF